MHERVIRLVGITKLRFSKPPVTTMGNLNLICLTENAPYYGDTCSGLLVSSSWRVYMSFYVDTYIHNSYFELKCRYVKQHSSLCRHMSSYMTFQENYTKATVDTVINIPINQKSFGLFVLFFLRP